MKLYLEYDQFLESQPSWWQNFIIDVDTRIRVDPGKFSERRSNIIKNELKLAGAVKVDDKECEESYLEFFDDSKATWFMLKYS
jgi:hypothetical protein